MEKALEEVNNFVCRRMLQWIPKTLEDQRRQTMLSNYWDAKERKSNTANANTKGETMKPVLPQTRLEPATAIESRPGWDVPAEHHCHQTVISISRDTKEHKQKSFKAPTKVKTVSSAQPQRQSEPEVQMVGESFPSVPAVPSERVPQKRGKVLAIDAPWLRNRTKASIPGADNKSSEVITLSPDEDVSIGNLVSWENAMKSKYIDTRHTKEDWRFILNDEFYEAFQSRVPDRYKLAAIEEIISAFILVEGPPCIPAESNVQVNSYREKAQPELEVVSDDSLSFSDSYNASEDMFQPSMDNLLRNEVREWTPSPSPFPPQRGPSQEEGSLAIKDPERNGSPPPRHNTGRKEDFSQSEAREWTPSPPPFPPQQGPSQDKGSPANKDHDRSRSPLPNHNSEANQLWEVQRDEIHRENRIAHMQDHKAEVCQDREVRERRSSSPHVQHLKTPGEGKQREGRRSPPGSHHYGIQQNRDSSSDYPQKHQTDTHQTKDSREGLERRRSPLRHLAHNDGIHREGRRSPPGNHHSRVKDHHLDTGQTGNSKERMRSPQHDSSTTRQGARDKEKRRSPLGDRSSGAQKQDHYSPVQRDSNRRERRHSPSLGRRSETPHNDKHREGRRSPQADHPHQGRNLEGRRSPTRERNQKTPHDNYRSNRSSPSRDRHACHDRNHGERSPRRHSPPSKHHSEEGSRERRRSSPQPPENHLKNQTGRMDHIYSEAAQGSNAGKGGRLIHSPPNREDESPPAKRATGVSTRNRSGRNENPLNVRPHTVEVRSIPNDASGRPYFSAMDLVMAYPRGIYNCRGQDDPGSNFYYCDLVVDRVLFKAGECCYAYTKWMEVGDPVKADFILTKCLTGPLAQKYGKLKTNRQRDIWHNVRLQKQVVIWQHKQVQNVAFQKLTKELIGKIIVHDVPDEFWGNHRFVNGKQWFGGHNKYGKGLMAFIDVIYPQYAADLSGLADSVREEMEDLRDLVRASLRDWKKISRPPKTSINESEVDPHDALIKVMVGDSIFNDGKERESNNMILLSMVREVMGSKVYVAAYPGDKTQDILKKVDTATIMRKLPRGVDNEQVSDTILGVGVNDVMGLQQRRDIIRLSKDQLEELVDEIAVRYEDTVKALFFQFPNAAVHVSGVLNHPRVMEKPRGREIRDYLASAIRSRLGNRVTYFTPKISPSAWGERGNDGLHLSSKGKFEYAEQLRDHFRALQPFRASRYSSW